MSVRYVTAYHSNDTTRPTAACESMFWFSKTNVIHSTAARLSDAHRLRMSSVQHFHSNDEDSYAPAFIPDSVSLRNSAEIVNRNANAD
jgi:hypothetical protein